LHNTKVLRNTRIQIDMFSVVALCKARSIKENFVSFDLSNKDSRTMLVEYRILVTKLLKIQIGPFIE